MNILVTGSNGQLGNEMRALAPRYAIHTYYYTDVAELDITDRHAVDAFVENNSIDCIVNCAAYTAVDKAEEEISIAGTLNSVAPGYLAAAVQRRDGIMVHVSTDYVFDGTGHVPYTEDSVPNPVSVYGRTKLAGENAVMQACRRAVILRTSWLYSGYGNNFVKTMLRLGKERDNIGVVFDQIGTPTYARDLAQAIFTIIESGVVPGIYHFSNEGVTSWYDLTLAIHRLAGIDACRVTPLHTVDYPTPAARPHYSVLDKTKIKRIYGIDIPHWERSLEDCLTTTCQISAANVRNSD